MASVPHLPGAACRGKWEIFDAEDPADPRAEQALGLCARCPALAACTAWIDGLPPTLRPAGVVAGRLPPTPPKKRTRGPSPTAVDNNAIRGRPGLELQQRRRTPA
ncbi:WhiB family transcriptional regulator [Mycolicibacterium novocastrense]|nr:WhiB family transcriptional regulator [Mycolicibacterium novocastrense]